MTDRFDPLTPPGALPTPTALPRRGALARLAALAGSGAALGVPGFALPGLALPSLAHAGAQSEEALADSVRSALSAAVAAAPPPQLRFATPAEEASFRAWLAPRSELLTKRVAEPLVREEFLHTMWYEARRAGLEPNLVLGLIQVESGFRKYAISHAGARGYMQVMPFWARTIGDGDAARLFHTQTNLRFGCVILRHYLNREQGDLFLALGRYNGSRGRAEYPNLVMGARKRWV